jgi:hypothetical protein
VASALCVSASLARSRPTDGVGLRKAEEFGAAVNFQDPGVGAGVRQVERRLPQGLRMTGGDAKS